MRPPSTDPGDRSAATPEPLAHPVPQRPLIIERSDLQTFAQRYGYLSVTFLFWFLWLYLFVPLLALVAWAFGATLVYQVMIQGLEVADLLHLATVYGSGAALLGAVYLLWAMTSYWRFRNVERRRMPSPADDAALAASHHLSLDELRALRQSGRQVVPAELLQRMFDPAAAAPAAEPAEPPQHAAGGR